MTRTALIFLLAVFLPALILGGLALRSATEQRIIIERQEAELRQKQTDDIAEEIRLALNAEHQLFTEAVQTLLSEDTPQNFAMNCQSLMPRVWERPGIPFAVTVDGQILAPSLGGKFLNTANERFIADNGDFLGNKIAVDVYQTSIDAFNELNRKLVKTGKTGLNIYFNQRQQDVQQRLFANAPAQQAESPLRPTDKDVDQSEAFLKDPADRQISDRASKKREVSPSQQAQTPQSTYEPAPRNYNVLRKVVPQTIQQMELPVKVLESRLNVETSNFGAIVQGKPGGILSRFVQDQLKIFFWVRSDAAPELVFGVQTDPSDLKDLVEPILEANADGEGAAVLAVLNDRARPFLASDGKNIVEWQRPFVASEIGEVLPHWEVALYLADPEQLTRSANLIRAILISLIALALAAIVWGGTLVVLDTRRKLALVQKKTDFVSNVSHELKTPLTSIRMFAELLQQDRVKDSSKVSHYLRIISLESERLTRLINNVLDFAKMERNQKSYDKKPIDLYEVIRRIWEGQEMHLRDHGFETRWHAGDPPYPVHGDEDSLAQVIVNLISNAEKYSPERKEIELHTYITDSELCVGVLDRGSGVPKGHEKKIFEHFYRAHDSLSSGIQGSGLGLTLAARIASDHGGKITYKAREGGGSSFTLHLPLRREGS